MFEKLVLSSKAKRQGRTGRFFLLTTIFYSFVVVSALVVSVVAANPAMYERSEVLELIPPLPPPPPPGIRSVPRNRQPQSIPRPSFTNVVQFTDLNKTIVNKPPVIPTSTFVGSDIAGPVGAYGPGVGSGPGVIGGIFDSDKSSTEPPAPPPPAPKPKPEPPPQAKEPENKIVRVASSILTGKALTRKTPDYPAIAKQIHLEGSIVVEIVISPEGRVESARALGGHPLLTKAAVDAAYGWRFEPTILNGTAVRVTGVITFNFRIN